MISENNTSWARDVNRVGDSQQNQGIDLKLKFFIFLKSSWEKSGCFYTCGKFDQFNNLE